MVVCGARESEGKGGSRKDLDQPYAARANLKAMAGADALGNNLSKDENDDGGGYQAYGPCGQI